MILISHRGNLEGPSDLENHPAQIKKVLDLGYDCEIDVWYEFGEFYLGHDIAEYRIKPAFLDQEGLWLHCKNLDALNACTDKQNYFWHERDSYTLTSKNFIWTFPNKLVVDKSIIVDNDPNWQSKNYDCFGVCSDWIK
tara:strand:+ start:489 stop:902 length:414 start_codon:yes stop_codon:yes gene_type:complete